jgi:hypothetical protein
MCFSLLWIAHLLIMLVIICGCVAIIRILIPWLLGSLGPDGGRIGQILNIIIWVIFAVIVIWLVFDLLSCALGSVRVW